jgi:hypothetical protein
MNGRELMETHAEVLFRHDANRRLFACASDRVSRSASETFHRRR